MLAIEDYFARVDENQALKFRTAINQEIEDLLDFPEASPVVDARGFRRRLVRAFKFKIIYLVESDLNILTIISVRHTSQDEEFFDEL